VCCMHLLAVGSCLDPKYLAIRGASSQCACMSPCMTCVCMLLFLASPFWASAMDQPVDQPARPKSKDEVLSKLPEWSLLRQQSLV
jgi:hypothetical protein